LVADTESKENDPTKSCTSCQHLQTEMQQLSSTVQQCLHHFCLQVQNATKQDETSDVARLRIALNTIGDAVTSVIQTLSTDDGLFLFLLFFISYSYYCL
jgi:hypothetical protein